MNVFDVLKDVNNYFEVHTLERAPKRQAESSTADRGGYNMYTYVLAIL